MTTRQTPDAVREAVARIVDRFEAYCLAIADRPTSAKRDEWIGELSILRRMMFGATTPAALESRAGDAGEIETAENGEAMVCTGCGTTRTVVAIVAKSATAFTCCPERKMVPVRSIWAATPAPAVDALERWTAERPLAASYDDNRQYQVAMAAWEKRRPPAVDAIPAGEKGL
jgi:hypothetical protein